MEIIYNLNNIKKYEDPVVAIGVFDGLHLGHRVILQEVIKKARLIKGTSVVLTFSPHPQKEDSIYSIDHRLRIIEEIGVDVCIVLKFDRKFAGITAEDFVRIILVKCIRSCFVYVGENFRFGRYALGDVSLLKELLQENGVQLRVLKVAKIGNRKISSTYIRRLISQGKLQEAEKLLLRPVSVFGRVVRGSGIGEKLGFPTANVSPSHEIFPPSGIYAVRVILNRRELRGICYIGTRPTFKAQSGKNIEVYIFNFKKNIYKEYLELQFIKKIRKERFFSSPTALISQIKKDIILARTIV